MAVRKDVPDDKRKRRPGAGSSYGVDDIQVLEGLEAVRRRPGMYIGTTDLRGLHHLVREVLDNSIDEAMNGTCDRIDLWIHKTNEITVADNGRGIPAGPHPTQKDAKGKAMDALQVVMGWTDSHLHQWEMDGKYWGAPTYLDALPEISENHRTIAAVAIDGGIDCLSKDIRTRVDTVQDWIKNTIKQQLR